jgi:hypothetical protein
MTAILTILIKMKTTLVPTATGLTRSSINILQERLEVYSYTPKKRQAQGLLFLFDGVHRDAAGICNKAISVSEQAGLTLVAPLMEQSKFPKWRYQHAGIVRERVLQPKTEWTFRTVQNLIDHMLEHSLHKVQKVVLFGHSAGGQLLSRICAYTPLSDVNSVIIANPSSYVMPLEDEPAPYGFKHIFPSQNVKSKLITYLSAPMIIYLGMEDVKDMHLSRSSASMRQGKNRLERGRRVYQAGQQAARMHQVKFNWRLVEIPGIGHSSREMLANAEFSKILA